jgi:hypothetical protein
MIIAPFFSGSPDTSNDGEQSKNFFAGVRAIRHAPMYLAHVPGNIKDTSRADLSPVNQPLIDQAIEALCAKGCRAVWADIDALEVGEDLPETAGLTEREVGYVVEELKAIMAVYEGSCAAS